MRFFQLLGNTMAGALDACIGMLIAALLSYGLGLSFEPWFFLIGALFALLPDSDIVFPILRGKVEGDHRVTLMHRPTLILGATALLGSLISAYAGTVFFLLCPLLSLLWHYLHDTGGWLFGEGSIAWKWPLSATVYSFDRAYEAPTLSHDEWVRIHWLMAGALSRKELALASLCLGLALAVPYGASIGAAAASAAILITLLVWAGYAQYARRQTASTSVAR